MCRIRETYEPCLCAPQMCFVPHGRLCAEVQPKDNSGGMDPAGPGKLLGAIISSLEPSDQESLSVLYLGMLAMDQATCMWHRLSISLMLSSPCLDMQDKAHLHEAGPLTRQGLPLDL